MSRPAVFFDRDNTLMICDGYLADPAQVTLVEGAADAVARARQCGFAVVVVSNQSGVARGMFSEDDVRAVNARLESLLGAENAHAIIDRHEFCPFHPEAAVAPYRLDSDLRKPKPGMILKAARELSLDLSRSWVIGDAPRDIQAGRAAGCRTILFSDPTLAPSLATQDEPVVAPDHVVATLAEAMDVIQKADAASKIQGSSMAIESPQDEAAESRGNSDEVADTLPDTRPSATDAPSAAAATGSAPGAPSSPPGGAPSPWEPPPQASGGPSSNFALADTATLVSLSEQILRELRQRSAGDHGDFSVSKLLAGIAQILTLAVLFYAYLDKANAVVLLLLAQVLQTMTIALLIMGRQR
jgi:D-glycero-D-manno-heptose 1,7-bisphosphate phosphatase